MAMNYLPYVVSLVITKMPEGGYLVTDDMRRSDGFSPSFKFASTTIDESLKHIKNTFEPKETKK